jgi:hypothetical protein
VTCQEDLLALNLAQTLCLYNFSARSTRDPSHHTDIFSVESNKATHFRHSIIHQRLIFALSPVMIKARPCVVLPALMISNPRRSCYIPLLQKSTTDIYIQESSKVVRYYHSHKYRPIAPCRTTDHLAQHHSIRRTWVPNTHSQSRVYFYHHDGTTLIFLSQCRTK